MRLMLPLSHRPVPLCRQSGFRRDIEAGKWRAREWTPALRAAGLEHHRPYDMRHTYATWSLAAGVSLFSLSRRMGTSVAMIDQTYGHLTPNAERVELDLLDAYDRTYGHLSDTPKPTGSRNPCTGG